MTGVILPRTNIAIDVWDHDVHKNYIHFLSYIHQDCMINVNLLRHCNIYTSKVNVWYLTEILKLDPINLIDVEQTDFEIVDHESGRAFTVKTIDSNYCYGSVMFLFEGKYGNFLYAGKFRFYEGLLDHPDLQKYYREPKTLDILYYTKVQHIMSSIFPSRHELLLKVVKFCQQQSREIPLIFLASNFGKEELYVAIAKAMKEKLYVCAERLKVFERMGIDDYFTSDLKKSRLWILNAKDIEPVNLKTWEHPHVVFVLDKDIEFDLCHLHSCLVFPYASYCSRDELVVFLSALRPVSVFKVNLTLESNEGARSPFLRFYERVYDEPTIPNFSPDSSKTLKTDSSKKLKDSNLSDFSFDELELSMNTPCHLCTQVSSISRNPPKIIEPTLSENIFDSILDFNNFLDSDKCSAQNFSSGFPMYQILGTNHDPSSYWSFLTGFDVTVL